MKNDNASSTDLRQDDNQKSQELEQRMDNFSSLLHGFAFQLMSSA